MYHYVHNDVGQHKKGGNDPWRNVIVNLQNHLESKGQYNEFKSAINTLAVNSLLISIYRYSNGSKFNISVDNVKKIIKDYEKKYDFSCVDKTLLNFNSKILFLIIRIKFYAILVVLSRIRNKLYN